MNDLILFYFACHPYGDESQITVIDLDRELDYEKNDWRLVDDAEFSSRDDAINHARKLAAKNGLGYTMFKSRYNEADNEMLGEFFATGNLESFDGIHLYLSPRSARAAAYVLSDGWSRIRGIDALKLYKARAKLVDADNEPPPMSPRELREVAEFLQNYANFLQKKKNNGG